MYGNKRSAHVKSGRNRAFIAVHASLLENIGKGYIASSILNPQSPTPPLLRRLLLQVRLYTPLPRLPIIMLLLRLRALSLIPRQSRNGPANRAPNTILYALAQIRQLALRLLALALLVLANALLL